MFKSTVHRIQLRQAKSMYASQLNLILNLVILFKKYACYQFHRMTHEFCGLGGPKMRIQLTDLQREV